MASLIQMVYYFFFIQPAKRMRHEEQLEADATLFEVVRQGKMAMSSVVDDWIEAYNVSLCRSML